MAADADPFWRYARLTQPGPWLVTAIVLAARAGTPLLYTRRSLRNTPVRCTAWPARVERA